VKSSSSCLISEINGIIFGGQSSRFWMLRKHIISMKRNQIDRMPFFSWNCITLQLKTRDVDLVIRNESDMNRLLKFLVFSIKTWDGSRNTAEPVIKQLVQNELRKHER